MSKSPYEPDGFAPIHRVPTPRRSQAERYQRADDADEQQPWPKPEPMLSPAFVKAQIQSEVDDLVRHYLKRNFTVEQIEQTILERLNSMDQQGKQVTE